jgi:hypothetical protein
MINIKMTQEAISIDFSNDDWKIKRKPICILTYNKEPKGTVDYYGDVEPLYISELKNTYEIVNFPVQEHISDPLQRDVFINKGFPTWLYSLDSIHKVIGISNNVNSSRWVSYSDEDVFPNSTMPVNDLRDDRITHYLF